VFSRIQALIGSTVLDDKRRVLSRLDRLARGFSLVPVPFASPRQRSLSSISIIGHRIVAAALGVVVVVVGDKTLVLPFIVRGFEAFLAFVIKRDTYFPLALSSIIVIAFG